MCEPRNPWRNSVIGALGILERRALKGSFMDIFSMELELVWFLVWCFSNLFFLEKKELLDGLIWLNTRYATLKKIDPKDQSVGF